MQQATERGRRKTDGFDLLDIWEEVSSKPNYRRKTDPEPFKQTIEDGLWLQRAVSEKSSLAIELSHRLSEYADLDNKKYERYEGSPRDRLAAAFFLWPFHSARYYGYLEAEETERLASRAVLCQIQGLLYNNVRGLLDVMRLWFNSFSDADLEKHVKKLPERRRWRSSKLLANTPDLCAVDFLVVNMLELMRARPLIRKAIESIQALSVNTNSSSTEVCDAVLEAFKELRVAQMTVFYNPNPIEVKMRDQMPLYELVHQTGSSDPVPANLIPFGDDPLIAKNFRKLAHKIYSVRGSKDFPNFSHHKKTTIGRLKDPNSTTSFFSDGAITNYFLSTKPPVTSRLGSNGDSNNGSEIPARNSLWPLWYKQALSEIDIDEFPDWSDDFWWSSIDREELRQRLFPGPIGENDLHLNDHMSAYWDDLVATKKHFVNKIEIPDEHPTGEPTFGYLMELLLRKEQETRTSFFFALAQTFEKKGRLCQFAGGTFLGLERPGIPFSNERFEAIAARARGLVMAVAHYTTTHAIKTARWQLEQERSNFDKSVRLIVSLLKGTDKGYRRGSKSGRTAPSRFRRKGFLLFTYPLGDGRTDHDYVPQDKVGWRPSRFQIKSVFETAEHLQEQDPTTVVSRLCSDTWKALLFLGGTANKHNTLERFLDHWEEYQAEDKIARASNLADRAVTCPECFRAALEFLLSQETYGALADKIEITEQSIWLPSRPGIRFLITICRFIVDVHSQSSPENTSIVRIRFLQNSVTIEFDKSGLLQRVFDKSTKYRKPNTVHTTGIFRLLQEHLIVPLEDSSTPWIQFLTNYRFASRLKVETQDNHRQLVVRWDI